MLLEIQDADFEAETGPSGQRISATPKYLLVPPAQETTAEKWLATIAAAKAADVNPFSEVDRAFRTAHKQ